jgi:hypothetical protein
MAFGKKKTDEAQEQPANLFEEEEQVQAEAAPAALDEAVSPAEAPEDAAPAPAEEPTPAPVADPLAGGADALLSLFQEDDGGGEDRGALLDLAGEVEIDDLLEDLRTVAVALGINSSAR